MKYRKIAVREKNSVKHFAKDSFLNELLSLRDLKSEDEIQKF